MKGVYYNRLQTRERIFLGEKNATAAARDRSLRAAQASSDAGKSEEARTADRGCGKPKQGAGDGSTNREKLSNIDG